jgi:pyruvate, orthophosphate dikinase
LLDPPLHEFLPEGNIEDIVREMASETGSTEEEVFARVEKLSEVNPMLGFRGCRSELPHFFVEQKLVPSML